LVQESAFVRQLAQVQQKIGVLGGGRNQFYQLAYDFAGFF
jgi:hypothetical protein